MTSRPDYSQQEDRRLRDLYEVSQHLARFESVERTVPAVLAIAGRALPLRSAILFLGDAERPTVVAWPVGAAAPERIDEYRALYAYLLRGSTLGREGDVAEPHGTLFRPLLLPLAADRITFGALELEGEGLAEPDLVFASALVNQLAVAIDDARLYEQAQGAIRARDQVLAIVSHDLRTPLSVISLAATQLLATLPATDATRGLIEPIARAADGMTRLIADLLDMTSIEARHLSVEVEPHAVRPLVLAAVDALRVLAARRSQRLDAELPEEDVEVLCDRDRVLQVFSNLIGNAVKFTPKGGSITVRAERRAREVVFAVADTGPGIASHDLPLIFNRFWQAKKTGHLGTGLGLSIAKGVIEAHGGRIWVESRPGAGTTFSFALPSAPRA